MSLSEKEPQIIPILDGRPIERSNDFFRFMMRPDTPEDNEQLLASLRKTGITREGEGK